MDIIELLLQLSQYGPELGDIPSHLYELMESIGFDFDSVLGTDYEGPAPGEGNGPEPIPGTSSVEGNGPSSNG